MSWLSSRGLPAGAVLLSLALANGCSSSSSDGATASVASTFCDASRSSMRKCASSTTDCDTTLTNQCVKLDSILNKSLLDASRDCLESGVCGASSCVSRAKTSMTPLPAHTTLANDYCAACEPSNTGCAAQFYAKKGNAPGAAILPYGSSVATSIDQTCTHDPNCASTFATCATQRIAQIVSDLLSSDIAACIASSLQADATSTAPGGGPTVSQCNADNCDGCCRNDQCETGDTTDGCGTGGVACATCSGAQSCTAGACREPCGPDNCPGCCDATGACVDGTTSSACGTGGGTCETCSARGSSYQCLEQQCIDTSCAATCAGCCDTNGCRPGTAATGCGVGGKACVNCGSGNICNPSSYTCYLDPDGTWDFFAASAVVPATKTTGDSWDSFGGLPDPYVVVYSSGAKFTGPTVNDTTSPVWNVTTLTGIKASQLKANLSFEVWDADNGFYVDPDDFMGGCTISLSDASFDGKLKSVTCASTASQGVVKLTYKLVKH